MSEASSGESSSGNESDRLTPTTGRASIPRFIRGQPSAAATSHRTRSPSTRLACRNDASTAGLRAAATRATRSMWVARVNARYGASSDAASSPSTRRAVASEGVVPSESRTRAASRCVGGLSRWTSSSPTLAARPTTRPTSRRPSSVARALPSRSASWASVSMIAGLTATRPSSTARASAATARRCRAPSWASSIASSSGHASGSRAAVSSSQSNRGTTLAPFRLAGRGSSRASQSGAGPAATSAASRRSTSQAAATRSAFGR
jgi:hypothetical protein